MVLCSRCEALPSNLPENGTLFISPPLAHTYTILKTYLRHAGIPFEEPFPTIIAIPIARNTLQRLNNELRHAISEVEMQDSKSLVVADGVVPSIVDLMNMQPLSTLLGLVQNEWLIDMMREERLLSHFQPIVHTAQPTRVFAHEALLRGTERDGSLIYPNRIFEAAVSTDLLFQLDRAARVTAVRDAARYNIAGNLFVNFNPTSIYDPTYCLRTTLKAMGDARMSPEHVVFEVVESSEIKDSDHLLKILGFYRDKGFRIALDDLGAGYGSLNLLSKLRPDFVKLDMQLIRDVDKDVYKAQVASKILEMASNLGVETIVEGVETEGEWLWAREHGATYAQGYLFARPAAPPSKPMMPSSVSHVASTIS